MLDGIAPLLDQLVEHRQDLGVAERDSLAHPPLLDRGEYEADDVKSALIAHLQGSLHVILDALFEHGVCSVGGSGLVKAVPTPVLTL